MKRKSIKFNRSVPALLAAVSILLAALALPLVTAANEGTAAAGDTANASGQYVKYVTYVPDLTQEPDGSDNNWDALFEVYVGGGEMYGFCSGESGVYGIGCRHKTPGRGTAAFSANVKIPADKKGCVMFAFRQADYTDVRQERKGIRICIDSLGRLGVMNPNGSLWVGADVWDFTEGRTVYFEDDAELNVITVSVDDGGTKVKVAECVIGETGQSAVMSSKRRSS